MKTGLFAACLLLLFSVQTNITFAKSSDESRAKADTLYQQSDYRKAYRIYHKLAKTGDHHSQGQLSRMFARGEGKKVDLAEAYAWSVLAAEGGEKKQVQNREALLHKLADPVEGQEKAEQLVGKYGREALQKRADLVEQRKMKDFGRCTGSRLNCS